MKTIEQVALQSGPMAALELDFDSYANEPEARYVSLFGAASGDRSSGPGSRERSTIRSSRCSR